MRHIPRPCLVDTNVIIVANGKSEQADDSMVEKCIDAILELTTNGGLVIDEGGLIFDEYRQNLGLSGQPGTGDMFLKCPSALGGGPREGSYLRREESDWLLHRAKIVRPDFTQAISEHWSRKSLVLNAICRTPVPSV